MILLFSTGTSWIDHFAICLGLKLAWVGELGISLQTHDVQKRIKKVWKNMT